MPHPPLPCRLGLESRLGLGLYLGLWEGWVGGFPKTWIDPSFLCDTCIPVSSFFQLVPFGKYRKNKTTATVCSSKRGVT